MERTKPYEKNPDRKSARGHRAVFSGNHCRKRVVHVRSDSVLKNLDAILRAAGSGPEKTVKTTCFLKNINDFAAFNEIYGKYFTNKPARSCVEVSALPKNALVEMEAVALLSE